MGPPSSGGLTTAEALNILEGYDLNAMPRATALHHVLEASRLAFADRGAYIADRNSLSCLGSGCSRRASPPRGAA